MPPFTIRIEYLAVRDRTDYLFTIMADDREKIEVLFADNVPEAAILMLSP